MDFGTITFTINDNGTTIRKVRQLETFGVALSGDGLMRVWEQVGYDLEADFMSNMIGEGRLAFQATATGRMRAGFGGRGGWAQLAESTVRERERLGYGGAHPILFREGNLATALAERGAEGNIFELSPTGISAGTDLYYAGFHQDGTRKMPARPIVGLTRDRQSNVLRTINEFVIEQVRAAALNE